MIRFGDMLTAAAVLFGSVYAPAQAAPILDFAVRVGCDFQQPERGLMDLHVLQGSTPLVLAMPKAGNTALTPDPDTSVRMIIGPTETGSIYAVRTNYAIAGGGYAIDWPTIGTNSSGQAWFYTLLFDREGKTYWSGSGALYIDASGYTGPDGVEWIEYTTPNTIWQNILGDDPSANVALKAYIESQLGSGEPLWIAASNRVLYVGDIAETAYGTETNTAYRGDWGASASNLAAQAAGWGDHAAAGYLPLAGHNGPVVLGTRTRGYAASTNLGDYGFAAGSGTSAGKYGFAAGAGTSAGFAGFAAGTGAKGAAGSFVFADSSSGTPFSRTNVPNSFSLRAAGGIYAEIGTNVFAVSNAVTMNGVELGAGGGSGISAAEAGQIATNVLSTATTNSMPLIDFGSGGGWTNLSFSGTGNAITNATAAGTTLTLERGTIEGGGGGGTADPFSSILVEADWTWTNSIYAVGANTSVTNIAITLPDAGTNFASVVVRKFSNLNQLRVVRGTNVVYTLYDDGSTRSYDWWPQYTNWYWRN